MTVPSAGGSLRVPEHSREPSAEELPCIPEHSREPSAEAFDESFRTPLRGGLPGAPAAVVRPAVPPHNRTETTIRIPMAHSTSSRLSAAGRLRRRLLQFLASLGLGLGLPRLSAAEEEGDTNPPREDDWLVFALGERQGELIGIDDLEVGAQQVFAYPKDPVSGRVRNGTRLNQVIVVRLDAARFTAQTRARAAEGVVAYSGVCSHTGCDVTDWHGDVRRFKCPCHESEFDPSDSARVIGGPAPWQLAALPLKIVDGKLAVAGAFEGRVGFLQPGQSPFGL